MTAMPPLLHQEMTTRTILRRKRKRLIRTTLLTILACHTIQMRIYYQFPLENLHTLMEKAIHFGVIKCVVIYFLSILVFRKL
jgi:DNA integrity scanning protein DisA with diadenylate cyclase activity